MLGVKHLNPRQGITTSVEDADIAAALDESVKHLNPRQGITTDRTCAQRRARLPRTV